jgi:hypothetical protein
MEVSYCNHKREEICKIKALVKRPDATYSIGKDGALTNQIASIEIRSRDVFSFWQGIGNYIKIDKKYYKIFEPPLKDSVNMVWKIEAIESV